MGKIYPKPARTAARACVANRVAGFCGALTGYRWGVARKRQLPEAESTKA